MSETDHQPANWLLRHPALMLFMVIVLFIGGLEGWNTYQGWRHRHTPTASTMITEAIHLHNLWPPNDDEIVPSVTLATIVCRYLSAGGDTTTGFGVVTDKNWYFFAGAGQISGIPTKHLPTCSDVAGDKQPHTNKNTVYYEALASDAQ